MDEGDADDAMEADPELSCSQVPGILNMLAIWGFSVS